ncbi:MAG: glycosyltransferase [Phenylobacterium sp.]|nr:MAG: glycosyltransferase [Phenylobacterium sp.]
MRSGASRCDAADGPGGLRISYGRCGCRGRTGRSPARPIAAGTRPPGCSRLMGPDLKLAKGADIGAPAPRTPAGCSAPPSEAQPARVLHIVENLDRGAVENWLVRMLRHAHRRGVRLDWTFYCALGRAGALDDEVRALGAQIIYSPAPIGWKIPFVAALRNAARAGRYDVVHCHHDLVSGIYLLALTGLPIGRRIVHAHNADEDVPTPSRIKQTLYRGPLRQICLRTADKIVGISNHTLDTLLAGRPRRAGRDLVHYYGVDPAPFEGVDTGRARLRRELALTPEAKILLFAGRLVPEKNPLAAVDVLAAMHRRDPSVVGLFVGAGSMEPALKARVSELGLQAATHFLGWRGDVPAVMSACDWFILPRPEHPQEGFGLAVVEAQLAGLRLLLSYGIPDDPLLPTATCRRLPLADSPEIWADAAFDMLRTPRPDRSAALAALADSPMDLDTALAGLIGLHG